MSALLFAGVLAALAAFSGNGKASGAAKFFINPLPSGRLTSRFGKRTHPVTGEQGKQHNGIDLAAPTGTIIYAPADGVVSGRNSNSIGGNQLFIVHNNGLQTGYSHLSGYLVQTGQTVKRGDPIAKVGNTGRSTGPHLHWSVKNKAGEFLDPEKYLIDSSISGYNINELNRDKTDLTGCCCE